MKYNKGSDVAVSKSFKAKEFDCPCSSCKETIIDPMLVVLVQKMRDELKKPFQITSAYRCSAKQADLKAQGYETAVGVSQHELGRAVDVRCKDETGDSLEKVARHCGFKAVGVGKTFVHVDLRSDKERRWTYSY